MMDKPPVDQAVQQLRGLRLVAPATSELIHLFREVAAGFGARLEYTYDEIEDLALAVNEAGGYLLRLQPACTELTLEMTPLDEGVLSVSLSVDGTTDRSPTPDSVEWMMWHVLGALTHDASLVHEGDGPKIRFLSRRASA